LVGGVKAAEGAQDALEAVQNQQRAGGVEDSPQLLDRVSAREILAVDLAAAKVRDRGQVLNFNFSKLRLRMWSRQSHEKLKFKT
jgi:hypothetical protein